MLISCILTAVTVYCETLVYSILNNKHLVWIWDTALLRTEIVIPVLQDIRADKEGVCFQRGFCCLSRDVLI